MAVKELAINKQNRLPRITYRNSEVVENYLLGYPKINVFLNSIWPSLIRYFGQAVGVELEVLYYPEEMEVEELVGWIQFEGTDVEEGLELLEQFEDEVLERQLEYLGDTFFFNIEFI